MEKTRERNDKSVSSETELATNLTSLESRDDSNDAANNRMEICAPETFLRRGKKIQKRQKMTKKNISSVPIDIRFNLNNEPCALQFADETTTNNQIDEATFQPVNEEDNRDVSIQFPYIENAPSVGSEIEQLEDYEYEPMESPYLDFFRDSDLPCKVEHFYHYYMMKHRLIETYALNVLHFLRKRDLPPPSSFCSDFSTLPYCFLCLKLLKFHIKSNDVSVTAKLIQHLKKCSRCFDTGDRFVDGLVKDETKSKVEKYFSVVQLALEYITVPHDEVRRRNIWVITFFKRESFVKQFYDTYTCLLCREGNLAENQTFETEINGSYQSLYEHITSKAHQDYKSKLEAVTEIQEIITEIHETFRLYEVERYHCAICNYEDPLEMSFIMHLNSTAHATQLAATPKRLRKHFKYYYCYACLFFWFGKWKSFKQHGDQDYHKNRMLYYPYIEHMPKDCLDLLTHIKQNRQVIVADSNLVLQNTRITTNLLCNLKKDLLPIFPNIKMYPFGSRITGLALPDSDLDVFLDCENTYGGRITYARSQEIIKEIESQLSANKKIWEIQKVVLNARTPIIRISHIPSKLSCDIAVTNGLGVQKTKMIKCFVEAFPMCRELILFLKRWLQICNQLGPKNITSYALSWCVIYYLQRLEILPSVLHLIELKNKSWRINHWETGVSYDFPVGQTKRTFEELLFGFFNFYTDFDYKYSIVCPLLGKHLPKSTFWCRVEMKELTPYINYIKCSVNRQTGKKPERFPLTALSVQDPFDLSHNITKAMNARKVRKFRTICKFASRYIKKTLTGINSISIQKSNKNIYYDKFMEEHDRKWKQQDVESSQTSQLMAD